MFSLEELQNKKSSLKKRATEPNPPIAGPIETRGAGPSPTTATFGNDGKTNIPLPTISLQTLASARVGLHRVSSVRSPTSKRTVVQSQQTVGKDEVPLQVFAKRKELFEKQKNLNSSTLATNLAVHVSDENEAKIFTVAVKTLRSSPWFRDKLCETPIPEEVHLSGHSPLAFQLFLDFCQHPKEPIKYHPGQYSPDPWASNSAAACVLAIELRARRFEKYTLCQFVQNCAIMIKGPWEYIEERATSGSALSRFSRHWVAWNTSLANWWTHEYVGLEAADLARYVTAETRDPRILDIDHWYKDCGDDLNAVCEHDPIRQKQLREKDARALRPPPAEWGAEQERRAQGRY